MAKPIVCTKYGKLQGIVMEGVLNTAYIAFKGIPFAAPPLGELRFKDPEPPATWSGIRDASKTVGDCCTQFDSFSPLKIIGSEDCLYLNVYTPTITSKTAVMIWIHGGAFNSGSGIDTFTRPDYLITRNIILVTVNYRLGILGFLNLDHKIASGNQALKDQIAALRWVKENISNFGGDPDNVTIFGVSAGAVCVNLLALSPMAKGLFHKAIIQSGCAKCFWALNQDTDYFNFASMLGINSTDPIEVTTFLRTIPISRIMEAQRILYSQNSSVLFRPVIDAKAENPVLPKPINELIDSVDIPIILGYSSHEFIGLFKDNSTEILQRMNDNFENFVRKLTSLRDPEKIGKLTEEIKQYYCIPKSISEQSMLPFIQLLGDMFIKYGMKELANDFRRRNCAPTYMYQFSYIGKEMTTAKMYTKTLLVLGAYHSDETAYLFYLPQNKKQNVAPPTVGTKDRITLERLVRMWTNFAITGNPTSVLDEYVTITWDPATSDSFHYLDISDDLKMSIVDQTLNKICEKYIQ